MVEAPLTDVPRKRARAFLKVFHFRQAATPLSYPKNPTPASRSPVSSPSVVRGSFFTLLLAASSNPPPFCDVHSLSAPRLRRPYFSTSIFLPPFGASPAMKNSCHSRLPSPFHPPFRRLSEIKVQQVFSTFDRCAAEFPRSSETVQLADPGYLFSALDPVRLFPLRESLLRSSFKLYK